MVNMLTCQQMINTLAAAVGIDFDKEATVVQLRALYDEVVANPPRTPVENMPGESVPDGEALDENMSDGKLEGENALDVPEVSASVGIGVDSRSSVDDLKAQEKHLDRMLAIARKKREMVELQRELN